MKLTKSKLKQIIKEELGKAIPRKPRTISRSDDETFAMVDAIVDALGDPRKALDELVQMLPKKVAQDHLRYIMQAWDVPYGDYEGEDDFSPDPNHPNFD